MSKKTLMGCQKGPVLHSRWSITENTGYERPCFGLATCIVHKFISEPSLSRQTSGVGINTLPCLRFPSRPKRNDWKVGFALNTDGLPGNGGQESLNGESSDLNRTRLGRIVSAGGKQLFEKLNSARKNFPMKIFLLLLGFYTANALATILGQTGDWDVLVAGVIVAAIEGIGMLMYRKPSSLATDRLRSFAAMMNYWKAGVCLGLFVDAFKLGS